MPNLAHLGYPLAEVSANGEVIITKLEDAGGCVTVQTCTEQLLYEIEDPTRYLQPDVVADFSQVQLVQVGADRVQAVGASGTTRPDTLKVTLGYRDGFVGEGQMSYAGPGAQARGQLALDLVKARLAEAGYGHFEARYDLIGVNAILGDSFPTKKSAHESAHELTHEIVYEPSEVRARIAVRVNTQAEAQHVANEVEALYTNGPASGGGASKSVREVIAAASMLMPRGAIQAHTILLDASGEID